MSNRLKMAVPLALSIGVVAFLWSEFTLNFNLHWFTVADGVFGKFGLPEKFAAGAAGDVRHLGSLLRARRGPRRFPQDADRVHNGSRRSDRDHDAGPGPRRTAEPVGHLARDRDRRRRLVLLSSLSANDSLPAAPAFACAASVLFWWFATGLDNYVPGAAGPHTVAALGLALTTHPLAAGTGALGGLLSTPWPWVALSVWVSLLCGPVLGFVSHASGGSCPDGSAQPHPRRSRSAPRVAA